MVGKFFAPFGICSLKYHLMVTWRSQGILLMYIKPFFPLDMFSWFVFFFIKMVIV